MATHTLRLLTITLVVVTAIPPPMGYNTWYALNRSSGWPFTNESTIRETADALVSKGLADLGYVYVVIDDSWESHRREPNTSVLPPNPVKFPSGMPALSEYLRARGLIMGLYTTPGNYTCSGARGSYGHVETDVGTWVDAWNVGYIKNCVCNTTKNLRKHAYADMRRAIDATKTKAKVVYECDPFMDRPWKTLSGTCDVYAVSDDVADSFEAWTSTLDAAVRDGSLVRSTGGGYPSLDYLQIGNGGQTSDEYASQFALYAVLQTPLFIGTDVRTASDAALSIYKNKEIIRVHQDLAGNPATALARDGETEIWARVLRGSADSGPVCALFMMNRGVTRRNVTASFRDFAQLGPRWSRFDLAAVRDLRAGRGFFRRGGITEELAPHASAILRVTAL